MTLAIAALLGTVSLARPPRRFGSSPEVTLLFYISNLYYIYLFIFYHHYFYLFILFIFFIFFSFFLFFLQIYAAAPLKAVNGSVIPSYDFLKFLLVYCLWLWTFRLNQPGVTWSLQLILSIWPQMLHCTSLPWLFCLPVVLLTRYLNFLLCSTGLPSERSCFWHAFTFSYVAQIASFPTKNQSLNTPVCIENHFISRWVQFSWKVKTNV